jgi:Protein of unknown function (DUF1269)
MDDEPRVTRWWVFAGISLAIAGFLNVAWGIAAISNSKFFTPNPVYIVSSPHTWGWIALIFGAALVGAAAGGAIGHVLAGVSRGDAKALGEQLDEGQAAVVVIGKSGVRDQLDKALTRAQKSEEREIDADGKQLANELNALPGRDGSRARAGRAWMPVPVAMAAAVALIALAGCGSSSKPAYCSDRTNLENSIKNLPKVTSSSGISGLKTQITTIQSDATSLVNSAKSDFPTQTSAVKSSVDTLASAVKALPSSPSAAQIAPIAADSAAVVNSVNSFVDASKSKCS